MDGKEEVLEAFLDKYENKIVRLLSEYISSNKEEYDYNSFYCYEPYDVGLCNYSIQESQILIDRDKCLIRLYPEVVVDIFGGAGDLKIPERYMVEASVDINLDNFELRYIYRNRCWINGNVLKKAHCFFYYVHVKAHWLFE